MSCVLIELFCRRKEKSFFLKSVSILCRISNQVPKINFCNGITCQQLDFTYSKLHFMHIGKTLISYPASSASLTKRALMILSSSFSTLLQVMHILKSSGTASFEIVFYCASISISKGSSGIGSVAAMMSLPPLISTVLFL